MGDTDDIDFNEQKLPEFTNKINHEAKLKELLRNLTSVESKLCADASKEFIKLLKSESGPEFLRAYVQTSSKLIEIFQAWDARKEKPGFSYVLSLISAILSHPDGMIDNFDGNSGVNIGRALDKFARVIIEEKMKDLYKELNSKEAKRQNPVLLLLASIVRRSSQLAWEVAKIFDFKLTIFPKLAEVKLRAKRFEERRKKYSTRKAYVGFSMAFLEVGNPRLLRGVLQQKEMYSGVLRGMGNDDEETVVHILSILCDKVLVPESLVPPGLRSVLFGSVTLEQLVSISGRADFGDAATLAHNVLITVCTNPENGLMPDLDRQPSPLRGNPKRLLDLMKKLKATEVEYHKDLLLAIVNGRPSLGSAYLDEFPFNLEDLASPNWFAAVSLAANVVSSVSDGLVFSFVDSREPPTFDSPYVQNIMKCISPRPFARLVINKGLLHSDSRVKHGTLRLVLEELKFLESLMNNLESCYSKNQMLQRWTALKQDIQNEVRILLPDPQVLLSFFSSMNSHYKNLESLSKRKAESDVISEHYINGRKKLKASTANEDLDILIGGVNSFPELNASGDGEGVVDSSDEHQSSNGTDFMKTIGDIWRLHQCSLKDMALEEGETYFYSKLLDVLQIYLRTMPAAFEGSFDFFKVLPSNPSSLPTILLQSLLPLLIQHVGWFSKYETPIRTQAQMYRHLHPFLSLLIYSPVREIKEQAYVLAQAAMLSTGAFDNNTREICAWFFFIPGYNSNSIYVEEPEIEIFQKLSSIIVSFLCDAVSTIGNNLFKYMDLLRRYIYDSEGRKDLIPEFSPFIICILEKCLRLLSSGSGAFTLPQKTLISLYACCTIKYIMDTQVDAVPLSFLIERLLSEKLEGSSSKVNVLELSACPCEWRPLKTLLLFSRNILQQQTYKVTSVPGEVMHSDSSFVSTLGDVKRVVDSEYSIGLVGSTLGFSFSTMCTSPAEILWNFPSVISIANNLLGAAFSVLASIFFLQSSFLTDVSKLWPEMFTAGLESVTVHGEGRKDEMIHNVDVDSMEAASAAFCLYLEKAPFYVLFSAIAHSSDSHLFKHPKLQKLLLAKLSDMPPDHLISSLCNLLFWINQAQSSCRARPLDELETLSELCFTLAEHSLKQIFVENTNNFFSAYAQAPLQLQYAAEVAEIIFNHPAVTASLKWPFSGNVDLSDSVFGETSEILLQVAKQGVHRMNHHVLNLLGTTCELSFSSCNCQRSQWEGSHSNRIAKAFKGLVQKLFVTFKNKFDGCIKTKDFKPLLPTFYALHTLICFISPFELLELVKWLFSRIDVHDLAFSLSSRNSALSVGLHIAGWAFDFLLGHMWQPFLGSTEFNFFVGIKKKSFDVPLFEGIFFHVYEIASHFELDVADTCLLKAVKVVKKMHKVMQNPCLHSIMVLSRVIASIPVNLLSHCLHRINKTKTELLFLISEMSPLHLSIFGHMFSEMPNKSLLPKAKSMPETCLDLFSDDEVVMHLPMVFLYLNSIPLKFGGRFYKYFEYVTSFYGRRLLDGFSNWNSFVSKEIFEIGVDESFPLSKEEFLNLFGDSLLVKSIFMVLDYLVLSGDSLKLERRLTLFDSVCPYVSANDDLLDCDHGQIEFDSLKQSLNFVNRAVAKIKFCRMLLFPDYNQHQSWLDNGETKMNPLEVTSDVLDKSRFRFINLLIHSWMLLVKKFPGDIDHSKQLDGKNISLFRFLEVFIMRTILDLTTSMHDCLIRLDSLAFIELFAKSFLLYRFEDPATLQTLRTVLTSLSQGNFSCITLLQLLLAHSQFTKTIHLSSKSFGSTQFGLVFTPMQSMLRSLVISRTDALNRRSNMTSSQLSLKQLELIKLVRVLFHIKAHQSKVNGGGDTGINSKELLYLLLSSYGATLSEVDLEIYNLMIEIESDDKSGTGTIAEMDYLWGIAALKVRKEREQDQGITSLNTTDIEAFEDRRRIQFREHVPIDPKLCAQTVLYFPYDRTANEGTTSKLKKDNFEDDHEFASLGLLAVTFVSISSPDIEVRKLAYEALAKFKTALEKCHKRKDVTRLRLLLSYLQNGIEEPWQRITSITAVFVAEASFVLLDPSHDNYSTISKNLMRCSSVNMKTIPLFQNFFWSSSVSFKTDRLWILRLLYAGLNTDDDAQVYIRNSTFEMLMSFYGSPLSDNVSKELIIQVSCAM
ncbi:Ribosome 60S biogenesis N-terminal [Forsythia ovata]|uniref:Ribosome 60S biogenesis N-terminal n=1 Tax=Forsythia ovata TaxID=205694 RepID=A0ABD1QF00_9LAMI